MPAVSTVIVFGIAWGIHDFVRGVRWAPSGEGQTDGGFIAGMASRMSDHAEEMRQRVAQGGSGPKQFRVRIKPRFRRNAGFDNQSFEEHVMADNRYQAERIMRARYPGATIGVPREE